MKDSNVAISHNKSVHDKIAQHYDSAHVEIYNLTEQLRIRSSIEKSISAIQTRSEKPLVLDYGAGTGNISKHLVNLEAEVVAADVSQNSLEQLMLKFHDSNSLRTFVLNGENLDYFGDNTFDMVATYSVLHHVPDYLKIVREFIRVVKPGGIIYIDHEASSDYWESNDNYKNYLTDLGGSFKEGYFLEMGIYDEDRGKLYNLHLRLKRKLVSGTWSSYVLKKLNLIFDEGDIHTNKDDHIEWDKIENILLQGCEIITKEDYLVSREKGENPPIWTAWQDKCADMRLIIARKTM